MRAAFDKIAKEFPDLPLAAAIFNPGGGFVRKPFLELTEEEFVAGYNSQARGAFLFSQATLPLLLKGVDQSGEKKLEHPPTLIFTGRHTYTETSPCEGFPLIVLDYRRNSQRPRLSDLRHLRDRQVRPARSVPEPRARVRSAGSPRRACDCRRGDRYPADEGVEISSSGCET